MTGSPPGPGTDPGADLGSGDAAGSPGGTRVLVLSGPNLGLLGSREPDVYGRVDYPSLVARLRGAAARLDLDADARQSDDETDLVRWLHEAVADRCPVVVNPAAFTHYSYALRDAAAMVTGAGLPLVEVHLSNPGAREDFRRHSVLSPVATGTVAGFGPLSYELGLLAVAEALRTGG